MATIKQLIDTIKDAASIDFADELQAVYYEKYIDTQDTKAFPRLSFFIPDGGLSLGSNSNQAVFTFQFLDLLSGQNKEWEIREELPSDLFDLASRFLTWLYYEKEVNIEYPISVNHVDKKTKDGLTSISFDITINLARPCLNS